MLNIILDNTSYGDSLCLEIPYWEDETKGKMFLDIDNYPFIYLRELKFDYVDKLVSYASELLFDENVEDQLFYDLIHYIILKLPIISDKIKFMLEMFNQ